MSYDGTVAWIPITAKQRIPSTALQRAGSDDDTRDGSTERGFNGDPGTVAHGWHANAKGTSFLLITPALEACPSTGVFATGLL